MKKKKLFIIMAILVSVFNGCGKDEEKLIFDVDDRREDVKLIETGEGKDVCIVSVEGTGGNEIIPGKYLVLVSAAGEREDTEYGGSISRYSRYELHLYDLETGELVEVIDANKMMEQEKDYQLPIINGYNTAEVEGKEYIRLLMEHIPNEEDASWRTDRKYLNIEVTTKDIFIMAGEEEKKKVKKDPVIEHETSIFEKWGEYSLVESNGLANQKMEDEKEQYFYVGPYPCWEGIVRVKMSTKYLPKENEELYSEFPQLKEYQGKEGMRVCIYLSDYPSAEQIFKLFMEEGQEVSFEGAVLDAELSIDGQEHEIHSFEEYYQWRK